MNSVWFTLTLNLKSHTVTSCHQRFNVEDKKHKAGLLQQLIQVWLPVSHRDLGLSYRS